MFIHLTCHNLVSFYTVSCNYASPSLIPGSAPVHILQACIISDHIYEPTAHHKAICPRTTYTVYSKYYKLKTFAIKLLQKPSPTV